MGVYAHTHWNCTVRWLQHTSNSQLAWAHKQRLGQWAVCMCIGCQRQERYLTGRIALDLAVALSSSNCVRRHPSSFELDRRALASPSLKGLSQKASRSLARTSRPSAMFPTRDDPLNSVSQEHSGGIHSLGSCSNTRSLAYAHFDITVMYAKLSVNAVKLAMLHE